MSTMYTESDLVKQKKFRVQAVSKFPTDNRKHLIGKDVLLLDISGSTASIRWAGENKHYIPVRSLINVKGFTAQGVQAKNADGFAVVAQNSLSIPVGRAYLNPTSVSAKHASFDIDGKEVKLPLEILCSLVRIKEKKTKEIKKVAKETGVSPEMIRLIDQPSNREPITAIPAFVSKLLPDLNIDDIRDIVNHEDDVISDFEGNPHATMAEADKANEIIRHKKLATKILALIQKQAEAQLTESRNKEIIARANKKDK